MYKTFRTDNTMEEIRFFVNGQEHIVSNDVHPATRLSDYLRKAARLKGTKVMCREGGCGACVVTVEYNDPVTQKQRTRAINSCLCPIEIARGWSITMTEGLGSKKHGFHPIQQKMADHSATQCGYCTPGFVMSAYGVLKDNPDATLCDLEKAMDGNLCRCTGYRPIIDAMKSLSKDGKANTIDIEELSKLRCPIKKEPFQKSGPAPMHRPPSHLVWKRPKSLDQLLSLLDANISRKTRLVFGNTATGVFKRERYELFVDIHDIPELYKVTEGNGFLELGANLSLSDLQEVFKKYTSKQGFEYMSKLSEFTGIIGTTPIRNAGSWAGNLVLQHDYPEFPSDIYTPFAALNAIVTLAGKSGVKQMTVDKFLAEDMKGKVIVSVRLPALSKNDLFEVYKVMPRNKGSHCYINAAFKVTCSDTKERTVADAAVVFNGLGAGNLQQKEVEKHLIGKSMEDSKVIPAILEILTKSIKVADAALVSVDYRKTVARNLLFKFLCQNIPNGPVVPPVSLTRPPTSGRQEFSSKPEEYPITQPLPKLSGTLQASGEVTYVDDIPSMEGELSGVYVLSTIASGEIDSIDTSLAMGAGGAVDVVTAADIPGAKTMYGYIVLAEKKIEYHGQPIALVVAEDLGTAYKAASMVKVTYQNVQTPIIDMDEAIEKGSFHTSFPPAVQGDPEEALKSSSKIVEGTFRHDSQYHFYLENQACLVAPSETGYNVWSSTQWSDLIQGQVASTLNMSANSIHVTVPRIGGGFGGKTIYSATQAMACAAAAHKTNRPVRVVLGLDTNMKITGHRPAIKAQYKIGLDESNTITAMKVELYWDFGYLLDLFAPGYVNTVHTHIDSLYNVPNRSLNLIPVKRNMNCPTFMRSPGQFPSHMIAEYMMEHVADVIGENQASFKQRHLYQQGQMMSVKVPMPDDTAQQLWQDAITTSEFNKRQQDVEQFNKKNKWVKRGLAVSPSKFLMSYSPSFSYPVYIAVYHGDGSISISHGGTEMGQGLHTKVPQVAAKTLGIPLDLVKIYPTNSLTGVNTLPTGGSQTSEYLCRTVQDGCLQLLEKLAPFRAANPDADWKTLVNAAYGAGINLAVTHRHAVKEKSQFDYLVPGVCVAEAEVDILTGQCQILRADMHIEIGQSVNPEIDVGQIEGALSLGLGLMLTEQETYSTKTGELLTASTWDYKPPTAADIPADTRIYMMKDKPNKMGVYSSKGIGEPPMCATPAFLHAVKTAVAASRQERGKTQHVDLHPPATPQKIVAACDVSLQDLN